MRRIAKLTLVLTAMIAVSSVKAQVDPHFTQYYVYPSWLNPALTGVFDGDYRVAGIYRTQWGNVSSPYSTTGASLDVNTNRPVSFGLSLLDQKAGDGGYHYTTGYGSMAFSGLRFGVQGYQRISMDLQFGFIQRRFDPSKLSFGDQWNPITGYNPGQQTQDVLSRTSASSFDAGAGILYYDAQPGKKANLFGGFGIQHLTQPTDQFSENGEAKLPMRYTVHAGVRLALSDVLSITPNAIYVKQGTATEKVIGAYAQMKAAPNTDFLLGANCRFNDAISPYVGFNYKDFVLGMSYDINTSDLGKVAKGTSSFEITLSFIGRKTAKAPDAEFICPRL
jgi:type IX secretion system PorP/SprF family membrane protein